jgi:hypothetical protein
MEERRGSNESGQALAAIILLFVLAGVVWTIYAAFTPSGPADLPPTVVRQEWLPGDWRVDG